MKIIIYLMVLSIQYPSSNHYAIKGYGDYNGFAEFHTGVDFPILPDERALVPHENEINYICYIARHDSTSIDCAVMLSTDFSASNGWTLEHLDYSEKPDELIIGKAYTDTVAVCCAHPLGRHVHLAWLTDEAFQPPPPCPQKGYVNPFDSLDVPAGYDIPVFGAVSWGGVDYQGALFFNDVTQLNYINQENIYGIVDIVLHPYSAMNGNLDRDSCGVREISYTIAIQNPYPIHSISKSGYYDVMLHGWRTLFNMSSFLPHDGDSSVYLPEFLAVYSKCANSYENFVTVTNSGTESLGSGSNCLDNVWTAPYNRNSDWNAGEFCRGAWDTRLGLNSLYPLANHYSCARYYDGRYAVLAKAVSQGTQTALKRYLPAVDISQPESAGNIRGVVVDNYLPYVEEVIVYQDRNFKVLYESEWELAAPNDPGSGMELAFSENAYFPDYRNTLGIAVKYSERMRTSRYDVKMRTESGGSITWDSNASFFPVEWNSQLGPQPDYEQDNGAFWQCYECSNFYRPEYTGRIQLCINAGVLGPTDLAGNHLDSNPATVAFPRDTITGAWTDDNHDRAPYDMSNIWGTALGFYEVSPTRYSGTALDRVITVDLPCSLNTAAFLGDSPLINGFLMRYDTYNIMGDTAYVLAFDCGKDSHKYFRLPTEYYNFGSIPSSPGDPPVSSVSYEWRQGDFVWCAIHDCRYQYGSSPYGTTLGYSAGSIVCVHSVEGVVINEVVTDTTWYAGPMDSLKATFWGSIITDIEAASDTSVLVTYWNSQSSYPPYGEMCSLIVELPELDKVLYDNIENKDIQVEHEENINGIEMVVLAENPVTNSFILQMPGGFINSEYVFSVFDLSGRVVRHETRQCTATEERIEALSLPRGVYVIAVQHGEITQTMKVVLI
ncbi:hypothetical protein CSA37_13060 [Candidatus Fermentibacteria bacterium]|nr:MAG: hypothetical protein CSA37_13060 [Candidatus Fermentibacteria bacterium]